MGTTTHPNLRRVQIVMHSVKDKAALSEAAQHWADRNGDDKRAPLSSWVRHILNTAAQAELRRSAGNR